MTSLGAGTAADGPLYAAVGDEVAESVDGGETWAPIGGGLPAGQVRALASSPKSPEALFAATPVGVFEHGRVAAVARAEAIPDAPYPLSPIRWVHILETAAVVEGLVVRPGLTDTVYVSSGRNLLRGTSGAWTVIDERPHRNLAEDPMIAGVLYDSDRGVSRDRGQTWHQHTQQTWVRGNSMVGGLYRGRSLAVDLRDGMRQLLTDGTYLYDTRNGGAHWRRATVDRTGLLVHLWLRCVAIDPYEPDRFLAGGVGMHRSEDGGRRWVQVAAGGPTVIVFDRQSQGRAFALLGGQVWRTESAGDRWRLVWPTGRSATSVDLDPGRPGVLFAGGAGWLLGSDDAGETWTDMSQGLDPTAELIVVAVGGGEAHARLYAGTSRGVFMAETPRRPAAEPAALPDHVELLGTFPNPFNAATEIRFRVADEALVSIDVFNLLGQPVRRVAAESFPAGTHGVTWDGRDRTDRALASGVYFVRMSAGPEVRTVKAMLLR